MDFSGKSIKAIYKACHFQGKQTSLNALNVTYLSKCFLSFNHGLLALHFPTKLLPTMNTMNTTDIKFYCVFCFQ